MWSGELCTRFTGGMNGAGCDWNGHGIKSSKRARRRRRVAPTASTTQNAARRARRMGLCLCLCLSLVEGPAPNEGHELRPTCTRWLDAYPSIGDAVPHDAIIGCRCRCTCTCSVGRSAVGAAHGAAALHHEDHCAGQQSTYHPTTWVRAQVYCSNLRHCDKETRKVCGSGRWRRTDRCLCVAMR